MHYYGELYGKAGSRSFFPTGKTGKDWDELEKKLDAALASLADLHAALVRYEGDVDGEAPSEHHRMMDRAAALLPGNVNVDLPDTAAQDSASKSNSPAVSG